jgi:hypothetical protein
MRSPSATSRKHPRVCACGGGGGVWVCVGVCVGGGACVRACVCVRAEQLQVGGLVARLAGHAHLSQQRANIGAGNQQLSTAGPVRQPTAQPVAHTCGCAQCTTSGRMPAATADKPFT